MAIAATGNNSGTVQSLLDSVNGSTSSAKKSTNAMDDAETRFLKLLTTQLKNQDPLNPMDNAQMTSQLAQISTVNGIEKLNATLQKLVDSTGQTEAMQAATLIGRQILIPGNTLELTDKGAIGGIELDSAADSVTVTINDGNGLLVRTMNLGRLDAGTVNLAWDGKTDSGAMATPGTYQLAVQAKRGADGVDASALQLAKVIGVNRGSQGVSLDLGHLGAASMSDIKQIF